MKTEIEITKKDYNSLYENGTINLRINRDKDYNGFFPRFEKWTGILNDGNTIYLKTKSSHTLEDGSGWDVVFYLWETYEEEKRLNERKEHINKFLNSWYDGIEDFKSQLTDRIKHNTIELGMMCGDGKHLTLEVRTFDGVFVVKNKEEILYEGDSVEEAIVIYQQNN